MNSPASLFWCFHSNLLDTEQKGCPFRSREAGRRVDKVPEGLTEDVQNTVKQRTFLDRSLEKSPARARQQGEAGHGEQGAAAAAAASLSFHVASLPSRPPQSSKALTKTTSDSLFS